MYKELKDYKEAKKRYKYVTTGAGYASCSSMDINSRAEHLKSAKKELIIYLGTIAFEELENVK